MLRIIFLVLFVSTLAYSQCPVIDFVVPASACKLSDIAPQATVTNAVSYSWNFCDGGVANPPSTVTTHSNALISTPYDLQSFEENGIHYMVSVNYNTGKILRYNFGNSHSNAPIITDLGNFGIISHPYGIGLWTESGSVFALVTTEGGSLFRLNFGNSIANAPSAELVPGITLVDHRHMKITKDNGAVIALIAGGSSVPAVSILNFGSSILNTPTPTSVPIPGGTHITGIDIATECNNRYALVSGYASGLFRLDFGSNFLNTPTITLLPAVTETKIWGLSLVKSAGNYHAFIFGDDSGIVRVDFGSSLSNTNPTSTPLGFFGGINVAPGLSIMKSESKYFCATLSYFTNELKILEFPKSCEITNSYSNETNPLNISYLTAGTHLITLSATGANNEVVTITKPITISGLTAPSLIINESGNCLTNAITFTGLQQSGAPLSTLDWDFGDGNNASGQNASNLYGLTGTYNVLLEAADAAGCLNRLVKSVAIYNEPVSDFDIPAVNPLCTNQNFIFNNTSTFDVGYVPTWEWKINGSLITNNEDLAYAFSNTSNQEIRLKALIPGCENEMIKNITTLEDGPLANFSFSGQCEDDNVTFTNSTSGTVTGYTWDFDDATSSTNTNPTHAFSDIGTYDVTLTASNIIGCNNTKTKSVPIYSKPLTNFLLSPPPFSCNGTPSQFNDLTPGPLDSNIATWAWNFGDAGSSQNTSTIKNPQHTYANAGNYNVSLLVTTNFFCSATVQLPVTISQTPVANFNHTSTCVGVAANFTDASVGTIDGWNWTIGSTAYTTQNPIHTFVSSGNTSATLTVTATNDCIGTVNKPIIVPVKLTPDFSVNRNCVNQQTVFTDVTNSTADPIISQNWIFGTLGTASGSPANFTFSNTGSIGVSMTVTTQAGCSYPASKSVSIVSSPQASFTPSPLAGAPPLSVQFTNTSVNATSYQWAFHDQNNSTSTAASPTFVYQTLGEYQPDLTAFNAQNCFHTTSRIIRVVVPALDVALDGLELMEFQNGFKPAVTIFNRGNVPLINLALLLNMSGPVIREHVNSIISPNTSYRHVLSFEIPTASNIDYFCIEAEVTDITPNDNNVCLSLEQSFISFPPYPNPSKGSFQLDWIMHEAGVVNLTVMNSMGQEERVLQIESVEGLNPLIIETQGLSSGVYFVKIKYQHFTKVYRVFVSE